MARQLINIGTIENDGTGDKLRDAMDKINDNFQEVYTELGGDSLSNLDFSVNTISSANSNGDIILDPNGTGKVKVDNLAITGNTISSTNTNGDITLDPDGSGTVVLTGPVSITGALTLSTALTANLIGNVTGNVTGTVSSLSNHDTDDLTEGSGNLYYTDARARAALSATGSISYDNSSGVISFTDAVTSVNGKTGAVTINLSDIASSGQLDGDIKGSVFGDDSTLLVNGTSNEIVGTINSSSGTITTLSVTTLQGFTSLQGQADGSISTGVFYGDETQVDRYLMKDSSIVIDETGTLIGAVNTSATSTFSGTLNLSGTVDLNGATVTNAAFDLTGDTTGTHYGFVDGDLIGSVFGDDSTSIIDGINKTGTLTELDVDDINIDGNTISAAGSPTNQSLILNVKGIAALQTNSDTFILQPRTDYGVNGVGLAGDIDNCISQDDDYLYKSATDYDGSTLIWKRAKLRYFNEPLFYVGADDSTMRGIDDLEGIKFIGGTGITTSSDAEGNITIDGAGATYSWSIGADDSTLREIGSGESVKIIGGTGITTSSDAEGNITINGHGIFGFSVGADDSTLREIGSGESFKIIGGTNVTTSSDSEGNITIDATDTGISNVVEDTTPQLGGELDAQSNNITNLGTLNTHTVPGGTGTLALTSDITTSNLTGTVLNIGADDSTLRAVGVGEGIKIIGGTNVTTTSDSEGNITVNTSAITSFNTAGNTGTGTVDVGGGESLLVTGTTGQINVAAGGFALTLSLDSNINSIQSIAFEGSTDDNNEITLTSADATADRTITLPDTTGYLATFDTDPGTDTITSTVAELNYMDGVTSNVQTQLDSKASATGTVISIGADDSTLRAVTYGESIKIIGGTNVTTTSDAEGNITVNSSASGDVADDTTPQLGGDLDLNGHSITTARSNEDLNLTPNGTGTVTINGGLKLEEGTQEKFSSLTSATGTVTHDCSNGNIFYHTSISADFTANFTNLQLDSSYATTVTLVLVQGASEFIPTAVQVAGAAQTINWQGGLEPTGTDNGIDIVSFTILNNSGTYTVLGQLVDF